MQMPKFGAVTKETGRGAGGQKGLALRDRDRERKKKLPDLGQKAYLREEKRGKRSGGETKRKRERGRDGGMKGEREGERVGERERVEENAGRCFSLSLQLCDGSCLSLHAKYEKQADGGRERERETERERRERQREEGRERMGSGRK